MFAAWPSAFKLWDGGDATVRGFGIGAESKALDRREEDRIFRFLYFVCQGSGWEQCEEGNEGVEEVEELHCGA